MNISNMFSQLLLADSFQVAFKNQSTAVERISTGLRINSAKDDASQVGLVSQVDANVMEQSIFSQSTSEALSFLKTQEEAMSSMAEILTEMQTLKTSADAALALGKDISAIEENYQKLQSEFVGITREYFNGVALFSAGASNEVRDFSFVNGSRSFQTTQYAASDMMLGNTFRVGETYSEYSRRDHSAARITWEDAKTEAESLGGYLAVITSAEENAAVRTAIGGAWGGWLGIHKPAGGNWISLTGESVTYTNWFNEGADPATHYAAVFRGDGLWNGQTWTVDASKKAPFYVLEVENTYSLSDVDASDLVANLQNLSQAIAQNGVEQRRIFRLETIAETNAQNLSGIASRLEDADYAQESVNNSKQSLLSESTLALLSQANIRSQSMLRLLYARIDREWDFSSKGNDEKDKTDRYSPLQQSLIDVDSEESLRT
jgi:flagellin